jgi:hypothetical protein
VSVMPLCISLWLSFRALIERSIKLNRWFAAR